MLFFVENPPDPPCLPLQSDDDQSSSRKTAFKKVNREHEDQLLPSFSIREYVHTSRHNHIEKNWPFSQRHLQLCYKHEIKDLLPPFEPPDLVRKQCLSKRRHVVVSQFHTKKPVVECLKQTVEAPLIKDGQSERESSHASRGVPRSLQEDNSTLSESAVEHQESRLNTVESSRRKCKLIVKLGTISDPTHFEDITLSTTISDAMASKVCPVCKLFSSTSNTTLNAHIDQCLAVEPTSKWVTNDNKLTKLMIKPMKKRSMVDIYTTALPCTLEELDRRNGSNWAADSSLLMEKLKTGANEKRQRLSGPASEGTTDENPVYFDSNGTKLRIISKISNPSISTAIDDPRKFLKAGKEESKLISSDVKKHFRRAARCLTAISPNKRLCSLESTNDKISGERKTKHGMQKKCDKREFLSELLKARDQMNSSESGILTKWVCSKRTGRSKHNRYDLGCSSSTMKPSIEQNKMHIDDSSIGGSSILSNPTHNCASSPNTLYADSSFYETQETGCGVDSLTIPESKHCPLTNGSMSSRRGACLLKLPNSSGKFASSPRSKRVEVNADPVENADTLAKDSESILCNDLVANHSFSKCELSGKRPVLKKPRMHRSIAEMDQQAGANPFNVDSDYVHDFAENIPGRYQVEMTHNLNESNDKVRPEAEGIIDYLSRRGREASTLTTEEASPAGSENRDFDVDGNIESHIRVSQGKFCSSNTIDSLEAGNEDISIETFSRNVVGVPFSISSNDLASGSHNLPNSMDACPSSLRSTDEHERCGCVTETLMPLVQPNLSNSQVTRRVGEVHRIWQETEGQCTRYRINRPLVPALLASVLPSPWDVNSEDLQEHSSLTSSRRPFAQDRHVAVHRGLLESPVSGNSSIIHPSVSRTKSKLLSPESSLKASDKLPLEFSGNAVSLPFMVSAEGSRRTNMDSKSPRAIPTDDQPCCCLWKKNLSLDVERHRRSQNDLIPGNAFAQVHDVQSTSSPVLRLMGKNLMVVKNDNNDGVVKLTQPPPLGSSSNMCPTTSYPGSASSRLMLPEGSVAFSQESCNPEAHFVKSGSCYQRQEAMVDSSVMWNRPILQIQQKQHDSFAYHQHVSPGSCVQMIGNSMQEVILIDDSPEIEAEAEVNMTRQPLHHGVSAFSCHISPNRFMGLEPPRNPFNMRQAVYHSPSFPFR